MQKKILPIALISSLAFLSACTGEPTGTSSEPAPLVNSVKKTPNISGSVVTTPISDSGATATGTR